MKIYHTILIPYCRWWISLSNRVFDIFLWVNIVCDIRTCLNVQINGSNFDQQLVRRDLHFSRVITNYLMCHELHWGLKQSTIQTIIEKFKLITYEIYIWPIVSCFVRTSPKLTHLKLRLEWTARAVFSKQR